MSSSSNRPSSVGSSSRFFGRAWELEAIDEAFTVGPIVTLAGPAGIGKTRLASEWALRHEARRGQAPVFVDLSVARSSDDILDAVASALGCGPENIARALEEGDGLTLVLDDAEGARDEVAWFIRDVVSKAERCALVTSRMRTGAVDEQVIELGGLSEADDARSLLLDRARAFRPDLQDDDEGIDALLRVLSGVPLAIELAAARVVSVSPRELAKRIRGSTLSTLLHTAGWMDSMRARYEWSLAPLSPDARRALGDLSVVAGEMSIADAEAIVGSRALVETLREHHLLRDSHESLALHAAVRELGAELADPAHLDAAFERWATRLAERAERALADESDAALAELARLDRSGRSVLDALVTRELTRANDPARAASLYGALVRSRCPRGPLAEVRALGERLRALLVRDAKDERATVRVTAFLGICTVEISKTGRGSP